MANNGADDESGLTDWLLQPVGRPRPPERWRRFLDHPWSPVIVGDLLIAGLLAIVLTVVTLSVDEARADREERLENLRFVRGLSGEVDQERPFAGLELTGESLAGLKLGGADLGGADLSGADLSGADLTDIDLPGANLSEADLSGADLSGADLTNADLANIVNISVPIWTPFTPRKQLGIDFSDAVLVEVDFRDASLANSNLAGSGLYAADLSGADLSGADLSGADLTDVTYDGTTNWPDRFTPPDP